MPEYNYCPRCGSRLPPQSTFCPNCGLRLGSEIPPYEERAQQNGLMGLLNALGAVGALVLAVLLTVNIVLSFAIAPDVIANIGEIGYYVFLIVPFILELFVVYGYGAVIIYLAVMAILVASWVLLLKNSRTLGRELAGEVDKKPSAAFSVATLFAAVLLVNYIVIFILEQTGNTAAA
ncbi:MAG TPA: zinc ribbon domain-containing protein, partial [Candidatus Methanomethylophilaceae archaeon]|nr:zinc ribbon domain-containing protein [Candidatus Methanomethylophilaceae archaeon]